MMAEGNGSLSSEFVELGLEVEESKNRDAYPDTLDSIIESGEITAIDAGEITAIDAGEMIQTVQDPTDDEMVISTAEAGKSDEPVEEQRELSALEKYWKAVKDNPGDFTGWTYLLQYVEQENLLNSAREAFDSFLAHYPYCYGYWKKYADLEKKNGNTDIAQQVFERGVSAIPLSVDLWLHYLNFATMQYDEQSDVDVMRRLFERSIAAAGTDFKSHRLWDLYLEWEKVDGDLKNVVGIYDKLLAIPTQMYAYHWEKFSGHVNDHHPKDILSLDEFLKLRKEVLSEKKEEETSTGMGADDPEDPPGVDPVEPPPGDDGPPGNEEPIAIKVEDSEAPRIREKVMAMRQVVHLRNQEEVSKRWTFEESIKRPYFHVKPLERSQLKNWRDYVAYEVENGTHERALVLFERCLIACALYEEFWLQYAKYLELHSIDGVRNVFKRACKIHLPKKPSLHVAWASFEERQGDLDAALEVIQNIDKVVPGLASLRLRQISIQRRRCNFDEVSRLYEECIERSETSLQGSFYCIKYARYLAKVLSNFNKAKSILEAAVERDKENHKLYLQLVDLEYQQATVDEARMLHVFDKTLKSTLSIEHRVAFSQRKLEFLEDFGSNISRIVETYDEHQKLLKELQTSSKKRKTSTDTAGSYDETNKEKKAKTESSGQNGSVDTNSSVSATSTATTADNSYYSHAYHSYAHPYYQHSYYPHHHGWGNNYSHYYGAQ